MKRNSFIVHRSWFAVHLISLFAGAVFASQQPATSPPPLEATPLASGQYLGVASCAGSGCHGSTEPLAATDVLQNEFYTWLNEDRHAQAYNVLFNQRSSLIARNMRLKTKAYESAVCLDCHSTNVSAALVNGAIDPEDGVQCEACHGPAGGWRGEHVQPEWTHEQSVERGMIDLRHSPTRASLCAGCHVGNASKEVDHELIASGHPVLAFELDNYAASMPPHWRHDPATHGPRAWAVGQVVKFAQSLDNLARHARGEEWPEFSDMSCMNCHHDLKDSGWRQERGWPDRAGLPAWSPQHWAVLRVLIGEIAPKTRDELDPVIASLGRGVARMNKPEAVAADAERARRLATSLTQAAVGKGWSEREVRAMIRLLASQQETILVSDVHTAEQFALSLQSLAASLTRQNPRLLRSPMMRSIDALFEELKSRDDYDPRRFAEKLAAVREAV
jgi:hypothetical protein